MIKAVLTALIVLATISIADVASAQEFAADSTLRGETLFPYDDQDPWKHGYIQVMPFYGGYHSFRPYNYKHVYAQSAQAAQWGVSAQAPYSQQFWHQYEGRTNLSLTSQMTEFAPTPQVVAPVTYQPAPAPPAAPQQPVYQQPTAPQGYAPSPQYSGQVWNAR